MEKTINGYKIELLSNSDMANYFERAFNSSLFKAIIYDSNNISQGSSNYSKFGNILQAYVSATGDLSDTSIEKLTKDFHKNKGKCSSPYNDKIKMSGLQSYFADHVIPDIIDTHCQKLKLKQPLSLSENVKVIESIYMQCKNNRFRTHSFNGALLEKVNKEGLDINKEIFKEELNILKEGGMRQAYKTDKLCFCELSNATFGYALKSPERLSMALSCEKNKQENTQTNHDYLIQKLNVSIENKTDTEPPKKEKIFNAGKKMIDFYFKQNKSAIAFMSSDYTVSEPSKYLTSTLGFSFLNLYSKLNNAVKGDEQMTNMLSETREQIKQEPGNFNKIEKFIDTLDKKYPDNTFSKNFYENWITKTITEDCLNNFIYNGNADGYEIEGGKVAREDFEICQFQNPIDLYAKNRLAITNEETISPEVKRKLEEIKDKITKKETNQENKIYIKAINNEDIFKYLKESYKE